MQIQGETNLEVLLRSLKPVLNEGDFVFCVVANNSMQQDDVIMSFKEKEGTTVIIKKESADRFLLNYSFVASWITLTVHSSLNAVGLTAAFSSALADAGISCNVVAAFYHDHIFVDKNDATRAMEMLKNLQSK